MCLSLDSITFYIQYYTLAAKLVLCFFFQICISLTILRLQFSLLHVVHILKCKSQEGKADNFQFSSKTVTTVPVLILVLGRSVSEALQQEFTQQTLQKHAITVL
jgi:hypothetical protein